MGHHNHGHAFLGKFDHGIQDFLDHFRVQCGGGLVKQHDLRRHAKAAGNGNPLLLSAGELSGILLGLFGYLNLFQIIHGSFFSFFFGGLPDPDGSKGQVFHNGQVGKQIKMLKHHADFGPNFLDIF